MAAAGILTIYVGRRCFVYYRDNKEKVDGKLSRWKKRIFGNKWTNEYVVFYQYISFIF